MLKITAFKPVFYIDKRNEALNEKFNESSIISGVQVHCTLLQQ